MAFVDKKLCKPFAKLAFSSERRNPIFFQKSDFLNGVKNITNSSKIGDTFYFFLQHNRKTIRLIEKLFVWKQLEAKNFSENALKINVVCPLFTLFLDFMIFWKLTILNQRKKVARMFIRIYSYCMVTATILKPMRIWKGMRKNYLPCLTGFKFDALQSSK
jgi:hypothetical protein